MKSNKRLKIALVDMFIVTLLTIVPVWVIIHATKESYYDEIGAWGGYAICVSTIGLIVQQYLHRETDRPSFQNNTYVQIDKDDKGEEVEAEELPF